MTDELDDNQASEPANDQFDQLVRLILRKRPAGESSPDSVSVAAYINGTATSAQMEEVQQVLADSSEFQRFYLEIVASMQAELTAAERETFRMIDVPRLDLVEQAIRDSRPARRDSSWPSFWSKLFDKLSFRVLVPISATAAAALIIFLANPSLQFWRFPVNMTKQIELDQAFFASDVVRGKTPTAEQPVDTSAQNAALAEFRKVIILDYTTTKQPQYVLNPRDSLGTTWPGRSIKLVLVDRETQETQLASVTLPSEHSMTKGEPTAAWVLVLPTLEVWSQDLSSDSVLIKSPLAIGTIGVLTVTYPVSGGFRATPAVPIGSIE